MLPAPVPSLYDRLGGVYSIATVVDDFINRIMSDPRLNANPLVDEAHHRVPPAGFKYLVTEMVCWATGGPQKYTGKSMADSHAHLKITSKEWEAFLDDLQQTLDHFAVPTEEQAEPGFVSARTALAAVKGFVFTHPSCAKTVGTKIFNAAALQVYRCFGAAQIALREGALREE